MKFVEYQGQHRISKIYLKQFGYKNSDDWYVSVWHIGDDETDNLLINNFTKETNVFDLPYEDIALRRQFENKINSELENRYEMVLNSIKNQKNLNSRNRSILCHFVASFICRSIPHRDFLNSLLLGSKTRVKFINEITMFYEDSLPDINRGLILLKPEFQLNFILGHIMNHLSRVFQAFTCIIIEDHKNKGWFTSDNPVFIDKRGNFNWIIPIESEIYFPLSKNFLLFMFHEKSEVNSNPLCKLKKNKVNQVDDGLHKSICDKVTRNVYRYLIFPTKIIKTSLTDK